MYLGDSGGNVYEYSASQTSDAGTSITSRWESRLIDFGDDQADRWKTISQVKLIYDDDNAHTVTVSLSTDDGTTWTDNDRTFGSGSGVEAEENFGFWLTGKQFRIKLEHASATTTFTWTELAVDYITQASFFETDL
jgi:phage major head subunit gpT-like protein